MSIDKKPFKVFFCEKEPLEQGSHIFVLPVFVKNFFVLGFYNICRKTYVTGRCLQNFVREKIFKEKGIQKTDRVGGLIELPSCTSEVSNCSPPDTFKIL